MDVQVAVRFQDEVAHSLYVLDVVPGCVFDPTGDTGTSTAMDAKAAKGIDLGMFSNKGIYLR